MNKVITAIFLFSVFSVFCSYSDEQEPYAVVLAGGGARGAYQIGVWKALIDMDVEIGCVYGVSVGAINGAVMAMNDFETAKNLWLQLEDENVMELTESLKSVLEGDFSLSDFIEAAGDFMDAGGIDVSPLEALLDKYIDEQAVRDNGIGYGLVAYSISDLTEKFFYIEDIPEGKLVDYILASANFPLFQRKVIGGEMFIDGGFYKNLVIEMIDSAKYSRALLVSLDLYMPIDIIDYITDYSGYELEVDFINPSFDTGSMLDFKPENAERLMRMGYLDCLRYFGCIYGKDYYIHGSDTIYMMYEALSEDERAIAAELLEIGKLPPDADFSEIQIWDDYFLPELRRAAGSDTELIERYAGRSHIDRQNLYSEEELINEITDVYIKRPNNKIYYDRILDFLSYLALKTNSVYRPNEKCRMIIESYAGF